MNLGGVVLNKSPLEKSKNQGGEAFPMSWTYSWARRTLPV